MSAPKYTRSVAACLIGLFALLAVGCSGDSTSAEDFPPISDSAATGNSSTSSSTSSTPSNSTTSNSSTAGTEEDGPGQTGQKPDLEIPSEWPSDLDEIFGRYQLYWDAFYIAFGPPKPDAAYQPLRDLTTEKAYLDLTEQLEDFRARGLVAVFPEDSITEHVLRLPNPAPLDKTDGNEVIIQDCWVDDAEWRTADGITERSGRRSTLRNATMQFVDGAWRLHAIVTASEESSGYQECAEYVDQL